MPLFSRVLFERGFKCWHIFFLGKDYSGGVLNSVQTTSHLAIATQVCWAMLTPPHTWQHHLCVFVSLCFSNLTDWDPADALPGTAQMHRNSLGTPWSKQWATDKYFLSMDNGEMIVGGSLGPHSLRLWWRALGTQPVEVGAAARVTP